MGLSLSLATSVPFFGVSSAVVNVPSVATGPLLTTVMLAVEVLLLVKSAPSFAPATTAVLAMLGRLAGVLVPVTWTERDALNDTLVPTGRVRTCWVMPFQGDNRKPSGFGPEMDQFTESGSGSISVTPVTAQTPTLLTVTV